MENKSTKAETERRIQIVYEMMCTGYTRKKILLLTNSESSSLKWDVSDRQVDKYIKAAGKAIDEITEKNFDRCYKNTKARLNYCYQKLAEKKDFKGAIMALKELSELDGLKVQKPIDLNVSQVRIIELPNNGRNN